MGIAMFVRRCGLVPQHKPYKKKKKIISLIPTIIGNNFTDMYILIAEAVTWFRRRGRRKGPGPDSVHQPKEVLAHREHTVLVLDAKGFPPSPPQSKWASLTPAHPLWGSHLAGGQRLHLESIISVLGCCTEPLKKRKPEKQLRDEWVLLPGWQATTWWQGLTQEHKSDFFFFPYRSFLFLSDSLVFVWCK